MNTAASKIPPRLQGIIDDFQWCEGREKLELLIQYAGQLPSLPDHLSEKRGGMEDVPECMTPVHLLAEIKDGKLTYYFDVPEESPTVRGFAALMAEGLNDSTPEEVLLVPNDFYHQMGLDSVLTHQRLNGISAILAHMKRLALDHISQPRAPQ